MTPMTLRTRFACLLGAFALALLAGPAMAKDDAKQSAKKAPAKKRAKKKAEKPTLGLRYPSLTPDGKRVVFGYRGDLWIAPIEGGAQPERLTIHEAQDTIARVSPDGEHIAFTSRRDGGYDIFVIPVEGGEPKRITHNSGAEVLCDWSPDGKKILFMSNREPSLARMNLYEVPVAGGTPRRLTHDGGREARYSNDGKQIIYVRGSNTIYQDNYKGSGNYDIYTVPVEGGIPTQVTKTDGNERWPTFTEDGKKIRFVTEERGVANFYEMTVGETKRRRVTKFRGADVHRPCYAWKGDGVVFELSGKLYHTDLSAKKPKAHPIRLTVRGDVRHSGVVERQVTRGVEHVHLSSDGSKMVCSVHGDIWVMDASGGSATRLTSGPHKDEWPRLSPNGKVVAFQSNRAGKSDIFLLSVRDKKIKRLTKHAADDFFHSWSPDGKRLVFTSERSGNRDIWTIDVATGKVKQLTREKGNEDDPVFSPDGKSIAFDSDRSGGQAIFIMNADGSNPRKVSSGTGFYQVPNYSPNGRMLVYESMNPATGRSRGLFVCKASGGSSMRIASEGMGSCWSPRGDYIYYSVGNRGNQEVYRVPAPTAIENREKVPFIGKIDVDLRRELADLFDEAWNALGKGFYDRKMHGVSWRKMRDKYRPMAIDAENKAEFQNIVSQMLAELNASHLGIGGGRPRSIAVAAKATPTGSLGATFADKRGEHGGFVIRSMLPNGPAFKARLRVGDEIVAINKKNVKPTTDIDELLTGTLGKEIHIAYHPHTAEGLGDRVEHSITPTSARALSLAMRVRELEKRAKTVKTDTKGKIGYIYLSMMNQQNLGKFQRQVAVWNRNKKIKGMIIDIRGNGGGNIHQQLLQILSAKPYAHVEVRGGRRKMPQPALYWDKPVCVLIDERSFSDAEVFPYCFKSLKLGKVIGVPTPGGVIGTNDITLSDGSSFRIPRVGYYGIDGTNLEGHGVKPDILVEMTPEDRIKGRDPQLARAIEHMLIETGLKKAPEKDADANTKKDDKKPTTPTAAPKPPKPVASKASSTSKNETPAMPSKPVPSKPMPEKPAAKNTAEATSAKKDAATPSKPAPAKDTDAAVPTKATSSAPGSVDSTTRVAGPTDTLADVRVGEWARYTLSSKSGKPATLTLRVSSASDGKVGLTKTMNGASSSSIDIPTTWVNAPLEEALRAVGSVRSQRMVKAKVDGKDVDAFLATLAYAGGDLEARFSNRVPVLGLISLQAGDTKILTLDAFGVGDAKAPAKPTSKNAGDSKQAPASKKDAPSKQDTVKKVEASTKEDGPNDAVPGPRDASSSETSGKTPPGGEASDDAPTKKNAPPNPLHDAKVGEWTRSRIIVQGAEAEATLRVVEVTEDEVKLESRMRYKSRELRANTIKRPRSEKMRLRGKRGKTATVSRETITIDGKDLDCYVLTRTLRGKRVIRRWICLDVPGDGVVRVERGGTVIREIVAWGTKPKSDDDAESKDASEPTK